eukprot:gene19915-21862_t
MASSSPLAYATVPRKKDHYYHYQHHAEVSGSSNNNKGKSSKSIAAINNEDWKSLQHSVTSLFQKIRLKGRELDTLNDKVRTVLDSEIGRFICEYYQDSILKKGMIILRENVKEKTGPVLLDKLALVWREFYTAILPTLLAIFYPIQEQGLSIRKTTLVGFRDMVLLKTSIEGALQSIPKAKVPSDITQMLLILASVHDASPPSENYLKLESLVARVVSPYIGFNGLYQGERLKVRRQSSLLDQTKLPLGRKISRSHTFNEDSKTKQRSVSNASETSDIPNLSLDVDMLRYLAVGASKDIGTMSCR